MDHEMNKPAQVVMLIKGMAIYYGDQKLLFWDKRVKLELDERGKADREHLRTKKLKRKKPR